MPETSFPDRERRLQVRAFNEWTRVAKGKAFPDLADMGEIDIPGFAEASFLVDVSGDPLAPRFCFVGDHLRDDCADCGPIETLDDVPELSLLSRLTDRYLQCIANRVPVGFEAAFDNRLGHAVLYRGILLPVSRDGEAIDHVWGAINCKDLAGSSTPPVPSAPEPPAPAAAPPPPHPMPDPAPPPPVPARAASARSSAAATTSRPPGKAARAATRAPVAAPAPAAPAPPSAAAIAARLERYMRIDGALAVALARVGDGAVLAQAGTLGEQEVAIHAQGSATLLRAEIDTQHELEMTDEIDDVLITLGARYHLIRPLPGQGGGAPGEALFLLLLLNKAKANLAMARHKLGVMEEVTLFN